MNNKMAKLLRKLSGFVPSAEREYKNTTMRTVMVDTGRLDENGNAIMRPEARVNVAATGARAHYQQIKRLPAR